MKKIIKTLFSGRFIKFCIIGVLNTIIHLIVYNLTLKITNVVIANTIAFILASVFSYFANTKFTYNKSPEATTFILVMITFAVKLALNAGLAYGFEQLIIKINYQVDLLIKLIPIFVTIIILPMQFLVFNVIYKGKKGDMCEETEA